MFCVSTADIDKDVFARSKFLISLFFYISLRSHDWMREYFVRILMENCRPARPNSVSLSAGSFFEAPSARVGKPSAGTFASSELELIK
jgi:hypothetical protein